MCREFFRGTHGKAEKGAVRFLEGRTAKQKKVPCGQREAHGKGDAFAVWFFNVAHGKEMVPR